MKSNIFFEYKFLISTFVVGIIYKYIFSNFLYRKIYRLVDSDFWSTLLILENKGLRSLEWIQDILYRFTNNPQQFAYFLINLFLIISIILSYQIIKSFKIIKRNITFKYIGIVYLSTTLNSVLASRAVINIRWTISSIIYLIFIIKLYEYLKAFCDENIFIKRILGEETYGKFENYPNKYISLLTITIIAILFLSIHTYSIYYLLSLISILILRTSIFFKQKNILTIFFLSSIFISGSLIIAKIFNKYDYLVDYRITGIEQYLLIGATFILHYIYVFNEKFRYWINNNYPWSKLLIMSTILGFIIPIPFMLTRIYVPYLVFLPIIFMTYLDKIILSGNKYS